MPVIVEQERLRRGSPRIMRRHGLRIGLVNNMPDAALGRTEAQFLNVLDAAAAGLFVSVQFFSLAGIPRGEAGRRHLVGNFYSSCSEIETAQLDGLILTGTEPKLADLRAEPYWPALSDLFDWIGREGPSTIFSCLAAHAAVLHYDGIERRRLPHKRFGLFDHNAVALHPLTHSLGPVSKVAHSRWNEVPAEALTEAGYRILTQAPAAGVDLFVRQRRNPLLFFQGHPEYDPQTLCREYQRDVRRFLAGEQDAYPDMPEFYFDPVESNLLSLFRARAVAERDIALMAAFPIALGRPAIADDWHSPAAGVYRAWLQQIAEAKADMHVPAGRRPAPRYAGMLQ